MLERAGLRPFRIVTVCAVGAFVVVVAACSTSSSSSSSGSVTQAATCSSPGVATAGAADTHCQGQPVQPVNPASCHVTDAGATAPDDAGADSGAAPADDCDYGATMFGAQGDDDDCKYHVSWTSTQLCEGTAGVTFTVTVTDKVDGKPVTGIPSGIIPEVFIPTDLNASCDDKTTHPTPTAAPLLVETAAGSGVYSGNVAFDAPGQWTIRFHIHEECADVLPDSQHGHAAFRLTIP
jgi:hypothetical protein